MIKEMHIIPLMTLSSKLRAFNPTKSDSLKKEVFREAMWVSLPILASSSAGMSSLGDGLIPTETRLRIRVSKPYRTYEIEGDNFSRPVYRFSLTDLAVDSNQLDIAYSALDLIRVVPNPYYAYSAYERSKLDSRVKITNLPRRCTVSIYSLKGDLVHRLRKDDALTYMEWDLRNHFNIAISSGIYIIHVNAEDLSQERVIKWLGVMRPSDLDSF